MIDNILYTACITPVLDDHSIDWDSYESICREQADAGNGLLILGSTGEALGLDLKERKDIVNFVERLDLKVPLMIGVGGTDIKAQVEWVKFLNTRNVDCYLMVTPMYSKPGVHGQTQWFQTLLDTAGKPCMLYNVPGRTGGELHLKTINNLLGHKNLWAVKEASGDLEKFKGYVGLSDTVKVYCGDDALMPEFSVAGAKGLVSVASNTWPAATRRYAKICIEKEITNEEKDLWKTSSLALFVASNPVPAKALMYQQNRIKTPVTRSPLSEKDLESTTEIETADKNIKNWNQ